MNILICIRQGRDGEINPFDACAYEAALRTGGDVTIISMGPASAKDFLTKLTRLGAKRAVLLTDRCFAGADTLATAYTLSLAAKKINPDLIFCGRQTLEGDTAQVGPMLSVKVGYKLITNALEINVSGNTVTCKTRSNGYQTADFPALITVERINTLRLPSIRSKAFEPEIWDALSLGADPAKCGLAGSPTRVLKTYENKSGKRKCKFISADMLRPTIDAALKCRNAAPKAEQVLQSPLKKMFIVGEKPMEFAKSVSDDIKVISPCDYKEVCKIITAEKPNAVLFGSDDNSKKLAACVAAELDLGLCADCTVLENENDELIMYRPALSGSIIAKIKSLTKPALATVRTADSNRDDIIIAAGFGVKDEIESLKEFAQNIGASLCASRKLVDNGFLPYSAQVGLTGRTVSPPVYIAIGISGAVHHIVGMDRAGTVIAVNPDKNAPIFEYADFGITESYENLKL